MLVARLIPSTYAASGLGSPPRLERHQVRNDQQRVDLIFRQAAKDILNPETRARAIRAVRACRSRDDACELKKLYDAQYRGVKYMADIYGIDTYQRPSRTVEWGAGDCDDHDSKLMSELASIGFRVGARIIATDGRHMSHIMPIAAVPKENPTRVVVLDTTVDGAYPGWQPPARMRRKFADYWLEWDEQGRPIAQLGNASTIWQERPWLLPALVVGGVLVVGLGGYLVLRNRRRA